MEDIETFEEYFKPLQEDSLKELRNFFTNDRTITVLLFETSQLKMNKRDKYDHMRGVIREVYYTCTDNIEIKNLANAMYEIDCFCGVDTSPDPNDLSPEDLVKLDNDKIRFVKLLQKGFNKLNKAYTQMYLLEFSGLVYAFNGYQAPPRSDVGHAIRDAYGLTNPFKEIEQQILENYKKNKM